MSPTDPPPPPPIIHITVKPRGGGDGGRPRKPPVIGLAGGIGSGKSHVAKLLAARGAIVSDSDDQAKALLREPGIADILARWWGKGILGPPPGKLPDRAKIAAIVFADHAQRTRLEGLIHPILKSQRTAALRAAARQVPRPPLFVIDAPLLFEAGLDKECDGVLFVDAPREERILRVSRNRGWTEEDLARREAAQLPVDVKKSRSTFTIDNGTGAGGTGADDPDARLNRQLDELWPRLITRRAPRQSRA